jgi:DNA-binding transcriptional ArsR family regulator
MTSSDMPADAPDEPTADRARGLDLSALRALAHPLRVRIMDELSNFGPLTASGLAERLGESSGSTSYHLRQLEKHDIVREVEGKGSARERWWKMTPDDLKIGSAETRSTAAGRDATEIIAREWHANNERHLLDYMQFGTETLGAEWDDAATFSTAHLRLTREQLRELGDAYLSFLTGIEERFGVTGNDSGDNSDPASTRVQIQFHAFPLLQERAAQSSTEGHES